MGYKIIITVHGGDMVLFLEPDVKFVQDGTRNEKIEQDRIKYSEQIKELFDTNSIKYYTISGSYLNRFNRAKELITQEFGINAI